MSSKGKPYREVELDGWTVLVGKRAGDNDVLTFRVAEPRDFWLHVADYSGSHVVIRNPDELEAPPREVLERAAQLAAFYSKAQNARGKVEVHVCRAADVRKPRGAPAGLVELKRLDALRVYPKGLDIPED
ncbi:MAG TPA: NFACT RNA binding domain-containing protein [Longimicrobiales bacterium]